MARALARVTILRLLALAVALCPRRTRFAALLHLSRVATPLLRRIAPTPPFVGNLDGYREQVILEALARLTRHGILVEPRLTVKGQAALPANGAILVSGHFSLNWLFLRWLHDHGARVRAAAPEPPPQSNFIGTRTPLNFIKTDTLGLLRIRRWVAAGGVVGVVLDRREGDARWHGVATVAGPLFVTDKIMRLAERADLPLLFVSTRLTAGGEVEVEVIRPAGTHAADTFHEFCHFLRAQCAAQLNLPLL
jgi:hypothetical protein